MAVPIDIFLLHRLTEKMDQLVSFEPAPTRRGTFDIIYSCISTLVICVWTTIHMNVSPEGETTWEHLRKKAGWTLFTIIFPEFMLFRAFILCIQAQEAVQRVNNHYNNTLGQKRTKDIMWTLSDGFFLRMHGFTYANEAIDATRIVELMERMEIPPIPSHALEIRDRSKADAFAKSIACLQASWLVTQCIARKAEGLPMSLLELGTVAYVVLSFFIYRALWFAPKDVTTKIPISPTSPSLHNLHSPSDNSPPEMSHDIEVLPSSIHVSQDAPLRSPELDQQATGYGVLVVQSLSKLPDKLAGNPAIPPNRGRRFLIILLDASIQFFRWIDEMSPMTQYDESDIPDGFRVRNRELQVQSLAFLVSSCAAWGTLHCLGWHFSFPSPVEKWLWRVCSILSTIGPWPYWKEVLKATHANRSQWGVQGWFGAFVAVIAFAVRLTLLVEMFISMRRMPSGVYENVRWTSFIPHF